MSFTLMGKATDYETDLTALQNDVAELGDQVQGIEARMPDVPSENGTYRLKAVRTDSGVTYSWEIQA